MAATRRTVKEYLDTPDDARGVLPARSNRTTLDCTVALFRLSVPERLCNCFRLKAGQSKGCRGDAECCV